MDFIFSSVVDDLPIIQNLLFTESGSNVSSYSSAVGCVAYTSTPYYLLAPYISEDSESFCLIVGDPLLSRQRGGSDSRSRDILKVVAEKEGQITSLQHPAAVLAICPDHKVRVVTDAWSAVSIFIYETPGRIALRETLIY